MFPTWINGPIGDGSARRVTRSGFRTVLVLVPHLVAGTRLMDFLPLIETDHRVQTVFTVPDTLTSWHGTEDFVRAQDGFVMPWHQAIRHEFDLVLNASISDTEPAHGPMLVTPHGAGSLRSRLRSRAGGSEALATHALVRENLIRHGTVLPSALVLTHDDELDALRQSCPEAVPTAVVAGDLCLDRMRASLVHRARYRHALGVGADQTLVVVSSTWSTDSVFGQHPGLYRRLIDEIPGEQYRIAAVLHPNIWRVHGRRQIRAWMSDCTQRGMLLLPPEEGWRAAMIAADVILGDHGSTTQYGAAVGVPTLLAAGAEDNVRPGSPAEVLSRFAPRLRTDHPMPLQLHQAISQTDPSTATTMTDRLTSRPGQAAEILRRTMYRLLNLPEPHRAVPVSPVPLPRPIPATMSVDVPGRPQ
jgi:hypothetical protein